ncbi:MAG: ornithine aminomutase subunit alpha [Bacillota bacterium]
MKGYIVREDDFQERRKHLAGLSDEQLKQRFWDLIEQVVNPMVDLARKNTTPSIERSILLRMGFSSLEAKAIVDGVMDRGLMGKGAGHVVYKVSKEKNIPLRQAGAELAEGKHWDDVVEMFKGGSR